MEKIGELIKINKQLRRRQKEWWELRKVKANPRLNRRGTRTIATTTVFSRSMEGLSSMLFSTSLSQYPPWVISKFIVYYQLSSQEATSQLSSPSYQVCRWRSTLMGSLMKPMRSMHAHPKTISSFCFNDLPRNIPRLLVNIHYECSSQNLESGSWSILWPSSMGENLACNI